MGLLSTLKFILDHPLNRGARVAALGRWWRWQLVSRLSPGAIAVPYVGDSRLLMRRGLAAATGNWYGGLQEYEEMAFLLHLLRAGDLLLDIGANIGSYTILAAGGAGADVIAVEPVPESASMLGDNVRLNKLGGVVRVLEIAVAEEPGTLRMTSGLDACNRVAKAGEKGEMIQVPSTTIDALCAGRTPLAIKIDIEGYEMAALRGGRRTLSDPALLAILVETNGSDARYDAGEGGMQAFLGQYGFRAVAYQPARRRLAEHDPAGDMTIFVRNDAAILARLESAGPHRVVTGWV